MHSTFLFATVALIVNLVSVNRENIIYNRKLAISTWNNVIDVKSDENFSDYRYIKKNSWCKKLQWSFGNFKAYLYNENSLKNIYLRHIYLTCRGPFFEPSEVRLISNLFGNIQKVYYENTVCLKDQCYHAEPELNQIMAVVKNPNLLLHIWIKWHNAFNHPELKLWYSSAAEIMQNGAKRKGYRDMGMIWKEETEINNLLIVIEQLFYDVAPLYRKLHAVVRYNLFKFYGNSEISLERAIPAHLLGNSNRYFIEYNNILGDLWAQNWENIIFLISHLESLTKIINDNFEFRYFLEISRDFFLSLGFQPMTKIFWEKSIFKNTSCHSLAVNMFQKDDYRVLLCNDSPMKVFRNIFHEFGHVAYFMEYSDQPSIFQDGVNSGLHESIGDAIQLGAVSPAHLLRLGLIKSDISPIAILLPQALSILPRIGYSLALEKWRWNVFSGDLPIERYNEYWWSLQRDYQGVEPPIKRTERNFDALAKSHMADNIPYIRYFIASFLQFQIFEAICPNKSVPLYRCDTYGSKSTTNKLRDVMSKGSGISGSDAIKIITGSGLNSKSLLKYFEPLEQWLNRQILKFNIPVGWN